LALQRWEVTKLGGSQDAESPNQLFERDVGPKGLAAELQR